MENVDPLAGLALALGIGLVIGLERGWTQREEAEGGRTAGLRTFALIGLAGGFCGLLAQKAGVWLLPAGLVAIAVLLAIAQGQLTARGGDAGLTTEVAALLTYLLGAAIPYGYAAEAAAAAAVVAALLSLKPVLHRWVEQLQPAELQAALKLLMISVVVLPFLPDRGFGPGETLNPYRLWLMVVAIAGLSFLGYVAARLAGPDRGALLIGLIGGLVSSTAATVTLSRHARTAYSPAVAAGVVAASTVMVARIGVLVGMTQPRLLGSLAPALAAAILTGLGAAGWLHRSAPGDGAPTPRLDNPLELGTALKLGAVLAAVTLFTTLLREHLGDAGLIAAAAVSGFGDVDAPTLSIAAMLDRGLAPRTAVLAIGVAVVSNTLTKAGLAAGLGGSRLGWQVGVAFAAMLAAGGAAAAIWA